MREVTETHFTLIFTGRVDLGGGRCGAADPQRFMQRLSAVLKHASDARPLTTASSTGFVVMSIGDGAAQVITAESGAFDARRNAVSATYNGCVAPLFYRWYKFMDWFMPGATVRTLVPKVILSQIVTTGANNPAYISWCNLFESVGTETELSAVMHHTAAQIRREVPLLYGSSLFYWMPVTAANYALVPDHLKILFVSTASVLWGGYVSFVAHRRTGGERDDVMR